MESGAQLGAWYSVHHTPLVPHNTLHPGTNNFILGIILQCATNDSAHGSWWKSSRFLDVSTFYIYFRCAQNRKNIDGSLHCFIVYFLPKSILLIPVVQCVPSPLHLWRQDPGLSFLSRWLINLSNAITSLHSLWYWNNLIPKKKFRIGLSLGPFPGFFMVSELALVKFATEKIIGLVQIFGPNSGWWW